MRLILCENCGGPIQPRNTAGELPSARELVLEAALRGLYQETLEYIKINHLGDHHHNQTMKNARDALHISPVGWCYP